MVPKFEHARNAFKFNGLCIPVIGCLPDIIAKYLTEKGCSIVQKIVIEILMEIVIEIGRRGSSGRKS